MITTYNLDEFPIRNGLHCRQFCNVSLLMFGNSVSNLFLVIPPNRYRDDKDWWWQVSPTGYVYGEQE